MQSTCLMMGMYSMPTLGAHPDITVLLDSLFKLSCNEFVLFVLLCEFVTVFLKSELVFMLCMEADIVTCSINLN